MGNFAENLNLGSRFRPPPAAFSSVLFQLISFVHNITSVVLYVSLYNLQLCLICMEMKLHEPKILLNWKNLR